jgi:hypothetical protein
MTGLSASTAFKEWLLSRPGSVQALAREFAHGASVQIGDGPLLYVIGWTEGDALILTAMPPDIMFSSEEKYREGFDARVYICAAHLRGEAAA